MEDQTNATRLFKQLRNRIEMVLRDKSDGGVSKEDVEGVIERKSALCRQRLPTSSHLLEKFPLKFKSATWWPEAKPEFHMFG